ncbi:MAG: type III-B CRISPR module RAMP protein Cmr4 [Nitrospirae bacterium]|nr:MAG: type III-B CRISPR module RAMP protein Cmr4 [Nitrospirota bacterium]
MTKIRMYWLHALSPTHVGTGRGVGYIDLPIHRDKVTNWPVIPASAFKGVWADHYGATDDNRSSRAELAWAFGRIGEDTSNAGALIPTDARLVCLPVRSFRGTFAWCTSPLALQMLHRDLSLAGVTDLPDVPSPLSEPVACHANSTVLKEGTHIYLEDLDFEAQECQAADRWATRLGKWIFPEEETWQKIFKSRFAVLHDPIFDFLAETGTEVVTRVKIDPDTKTVTEGQLWNEEALPAETILAGLIVGDRIYAKNGAHVTMDALFQEFATDPLTLQIGGKATVGRGRVRCVFTPLTENQQSDGSET